MRWEIVGTGIMVALIFLPVLAWKWRLSLRVTIISGFIIGSCSGLVTALIDVPLGYPHIGFMILIEALLIFTILFISIIIVFYRDPERYPVETKGVVLSPADGKVIYIDKIDGCAAPVATKGVTRIKLDEINASGLFNTTKFIVGIEMNLLNVHVNRAPIGGRITHQKRTRGKFMSLRRPEAEAENERVTTIITDGILSVCVIQIASRLVRRIVSFLGEGDEVAVGQRMGMIKFGSQVDLVIPGKNIQRIETKMGDKVTAGITVIARIQRLPLKLV